MRDEYTVAPDCSTATPRHTGNEILLCRSLGPWHLIAIGIGAIIGAGIFVVTGHAAAAYAGPAVVLAYALAGLGCLLSGLCYAEYASMIPIAGSAYTYTYATFGRFWAWVIAWNLLLEYLISAAAIAAGWSGYFLPLAHRIGIAVPAALAAAPLAVSNGGEFAMTGAVFNLPATALVTAMTLVLMYGVKLSVAFNNTMVAIKLGIVLLVIMVGLPHVSSANHTPFVPPNTGTFGEFGWSGVLRATGIIFFAYLGFDAVAVLAQETRNPQRNVPIGILGALLICTALYMLMSYVVTGIAPYASLHVANPVSDAVSRVGAATTWLVPIINAGAVVGLASVVLVLLLAQTRVFYAMSQDGLVPPLFGRVHPRYRTPHLGTLASGMLAAVLAGTLPLNALGELISIGTLAAFAFVCTGVLILRVKAPHIRRPFRTPALWLVAPLGAGSCVLMMAFLPIGAWARLALWTLLGLAIYFSYSIQHARPPRWSIATASEDR
jgi:APA family basic amino acid/polyamine antiporter